MRTCYSGYQGGYETRQDFRSVYAPRKPFQKEKQINKIGGFTSKGI